MTILVVDDDAVDRMAVRRALKAAGMVTTLEEADDSPTALALLDQRSFDCILLDYQLPGGDGLSVLREIRGRGVSTPIVMLTGQGDEELAVELMKAGAADYLTKGALSPDRLAQSIRYVIRVYRAEVQTAQVLRESMERLRFLAEASQLLGSSLDMATILSSLVRLAVPTLADWCAVDVVDVDGMIKRAAAATRDETNVSWVRESERHWPLDPDAPYGAPAVIRNGQPVAYAPLNGARPDAPDQEHIAQMEALGMTSAMSVPLTVRGRVLGAITFVAAESGRRYGSSDLVLAADLGQRAAVALDNAQHYHEAREAIRIRDEFLSVASHEFKTPLTGLLGNAQLLARRIARSGSMDERDQRAIQVIVEQASRLNKMIGSLLDTSQLQIGQFTLQRDRLDLRALVCRLVDELRPTLEQHTVEVEPAKEPLVVMGDELRLQQVVQNLVQNAVKYSPNGGPIQISVGQQGGLAFVSVTDHGIGIPKDALPNLFRRFYRAMNAHEQRIGGIGLGLYVVNEIVSLHGGTVDVTSEEGKGSTFTIRLPLEPAVEIVPSI